MGLTQYAGHGFSIQNGDTIKQESIRIVKQNDKWDLLVKAPEERNWIRFPINELKMGAFGCKNDFIGFPNEIQYWKSGKHLHALVSGDSLKIEFRFEPITY